MSNTAKEPRTDNWAEMSDDEPEEIEESKKEHTIKLAKKSKDFKNARGDYVVTTIDIPDMRTGVKGEDGEEEADSSDSDEGYGDEDDEPTAQPEPAAVEEKKPAKQLSKKERKAQEDAEFEALMAGIDLNKNAAEESKQPEKPAAAGEGSSKNKKKKEKKKAKAAQQTDDKKEEVKELTPEERAAALKAAQEKRGLVQKTADNSRSAIASQIKAEKEKRGAKKQKVHGTAVLHN